MSAVRALISIEKSPNLEILKKVFNDEELHFYFPNLFPKESKPPFFINKAHIGDTKIAGGDIVDGTKITGDSGMIKITDRGSEGRDSTEKPFTKCPYCGEKLNLPKTPKFCPHCGEQLR